MDGQRSGIAGMAVRSVALVVATLAFVWNKMTKDGHLAAAGRQGIDEIGHALKAFPDAIQAQETGTIFNPTQGEVAASRKAAVYGQGSHPSPSRMASDRASVFGPDQAPARSPSEIAADRGVQGLGQGPGQEQGHDHGRDLGRDM